MNKQTTMASYFLDDRIDRDGMGGRTALLSREGSWTFSQVNLVTILPNPSTFLERAPLVVC